jgi:flavin reductase (DIM6/NTAB) family NADH-FMN oxidoreductase RutF
MTSESDVQSVDHYRDFMSVWPTGIVVVTASDSAGAPQGMTCNSLCSVSVVPPSLLVSLHRESATLAAICDNGLFCINCLRAGSSSVSRLFASPTANRFDHVTWYESPTISRPSLTRDSYALAECRVSSIVTAHDHCLVLGDVLRTHYSRSDPLLYHGRRYLSITI